MHNCPLLQWIVKLSHTVTTCPPAVQKDFPKNTLLTHVYQNFHSYVQNLTTHAFLVFAGPVFEYIHFFFE